ncbi:acyl-CoA carboxylase subunit epsilon [Nakamurella lactea]|uniref:acyl-CoA carboxylase subunit epsilon n=1 Tax=Nakamurella lactea TaxID=459515 RepID=UPI0004293F4E|nr:acyl-CoA carboxylase subunit epsilon [Nakamurella lactea]
MNGRKLAGRRRDDEDAAAVVAVLTLLSGSGPEPAEQPRDLWGSPAHRLGLPELGPHAWWASGVRR